MFEDFNKYVESTFWLPFMTTDYGDFSVIHMPLVYANKYEFQHQLYCHAFLKFIKKFTNISIDRITIVDNTSIIVDNEFYTDLVSDLIEKTIFEKSDMIMDSIVNNHEYLPKVCIELEKKYINKDTITENDIELMQSLLVKSISINLLNPIYEFFAIQFFNNGIISDLRELTDSKLSYMSLYLQELEKLKNTKNITIDEIKHFIWNYSFLKSNDIVNLSDTLSEICSLIGIKIKYDVKITTKHIAFPKSDLEYIELVSLNKNSSLDILKLLAYHEEWRHYWQARVTRLFIYLLDKNHTPEICSIRELKKFAVSIKN